MRVLITKYGDFRSYFYKVNQNIIRVKTLNETLLDNHTIKSKKGTVFNELTLEHIFGFRKTLLKTTKNLSFHITLKTIDLQDIVSTTLPAATIIEVTFKMLHISVPNFYAKSEHGKFS